MPRSLTLHPEPLGPMQLLPLHQDWLTGSGNGIEFRVVSSAGLGGSMLGIHVTLPDGTDVIETCDIQAMVQLWAAEIVTEYEQAKS